MNLEHVNNRLSRIGIHLERGLKLKGGKTKYADETLHSVLIRLKRLSNFNDVNISQINHHDSLNIPVFQCKGKLTAMGSGLDEDWAKAGAVMEFMERYSWKQFPGSGRDSIVDATINELGDIGFREDYFSNNLADGSVIKEKFDKIKNIKMRWVNAYSFSKNRYIWYPLSWHNAVHSSNGLACGNSFAEAIVQAICEVIERHVYSTLVYSDDTPPSIDTAPSRYPNVAGLLDEFKSHGVQLVLKDMTDGIGIPTFLAWAHDDSRDIIKDVCGMGTDLSPETAAVRAITECAQARSALLRETASFPHKKNLAQYYKRKNKRGGMLFNTDEFYDRMRANTNRVNLSDMEDLQRKDILDDLNVLTGKLKKGSHEVFVINKTHPDLCIPTVRVFVPTLKYYIAPDITISLDSILARIYLDTHDVNNAVAHLKNSGNESLLKKAYHLEKFREAGIPFQECATKLENIFSGNMIKLNEAYCLGKDVKVIDSPANGKSSLVNKKSKQSIKIPPASLTYLKALEKKNIEQVITENMSTAGFNKYQFLDFMDNLLYTGFIEYKNLH